MHSDQEPYRELYEAFLHYEGTALYADVVRPWVASHESERAWLASFAKRTGDPIPAATTEEIWRLYALSRIVDLLLLGLAPADCKRFDSWGIETITRAEFAGFMESLGLRKIERAAFHPFFHEIVTVDALPDPESPIHIVDTYWPGYMLGPLLINRAGCGVAAGTNQLTKEIAEHSTLYWAFARRTRPREDQSMGWGSNSQWRTSFRRDYAIDGMLYYNVDDENKSHKPDELLDEAERLELLRFRCFVRSTKPHEDRLPYHETYREREPE
ncbi:MAG TPA: hypothetical protein VMU84_04260 [Thermoanaerobaculia bacterium]|nr:hypothetical protein [Thermoanaerobaculia bacterium]